MPVETEPVPVSLTEGAVAIVQYTVQYLTVYTYTCLSAKGVLAGEEEHFQARQGLVEATSVN